VPRTNKWQSIFLIFVLGHSLSAETRRRWYQNSAKVVAFTQTARMNIVLKDCQNGLLTALLSLVGD
jgi:hypothetical protein